MVYNTHRPTEECPLTKDTTYKYKFSAFCGDGLKFIITCFTVLTISITITLVLQLLYTDNALQGNSNSHGAVASDYSNCSQIGTKMLRKGGNALDAAIAATVCMTVVAPHRTGLGGAGNIMIYNHKEQSLPQIIDFSNNIIPGATANQIAIPAVMRGLEFAHKMNGKLSWAEILKPSITLAKEGFVVSKDFASEISKVAGYETLYGHLNAGDVLKLSELAETLSLLAQTGTDALYNGTITQKILSNELNTAKQLKALANYTVKVYEAKKIEFYKHVVYYPPHTTSLAFIIRALENLNISMEYAASVEAQILVAHALINSSFLPVNIMRNSEDSSYAGVMAMDWEDTYVCILTGLRTPLGQGYMTKAGFPLDKADGNSPLFTPIIFHKKNGLCGLRGVFGTNDLFVASQLLYNLIVRQLNVSTAIEYPRYYLLPDGLSIENDKKHPVDTLLYSELSSLIATSHVNANLIPNSINAILKRKDSMMSHSDSRGGGLSSRF